jgi:hypothetical protein
MIDPLTLTARIERAEQENCPRCPACDGQGSVRGPERGMPWFDCKTCEGIGALSPEEGEAYDNRSGN